MSYQKQFFKDGDVLTAEQLNHMEEGIANFSEAVGIQSIKQTTTSDADGGANIISVVLTDGTKELLTIKNGSKGANGKSAYDFAKDGGYTGTEAAFAVKLNQENASKEEFDQLSEDVRKANTDNAKQLAEAKSSIADLYQNKANAIKETVSGESPLCMQDTADAFVKILSIEGKSEQDGTSGEQLLDVDAMMTGYLNTSTGIVETNGSWKRSDYIQVSPLSNYCFSQTTNVFFQCSAAFYDETQAFISGADKAGSGITSWTFQTPENAKYMRVAYSVTVNSSAVDRGNIMLNAGTEALPWEPYTNGPSPNPDYPEEIRSVKVSEIKTRGKNLYNSSHRMDNGNIYVQNGTATEENGVYSITATGSDVYIWRIPTSGGRWSENNGQLLEIPNGVENITVSLSNNAFNKQYLAFYDEEKNFLRWVQSTTNVFTESIGEEAKYFTLRFGVGDSVSGTTYKTTVMVEFGAVATEYEPYTENSITLSQPIELNGIGDVMDELTPDGVKRKWLIDRVLSSLGWNYSASTSRFFASDHRYTHAPSDSETYNGQYLCTHFGNRDRDDLLISYINGTNIGYAYKYTALNGDIDAWKAFLDENEVYTCGLLATPIFEPLPTADQIALRSLLSYDGVTYLEVECDEVVPNVNAEFVLDTKRYIDRKFNELAVALAVTE